MISQANFRPRPSDWQNQFVLLALIAVIPMIGAQFGYGNQIEQFSTVMRLLDPSAMPGDFYVDASASFGPRYYYVHVLAALAGVLSLPVAVHGLSIFCNFLLAAVSYTAATRLLGASTVGGALAAVLAVTNGGFSLGYAGYLHFDSLQPASLAIPLALLGFYLVLTGRYATCVLAFTAGAVMHPLIGMEIAVIAYAAAGAATLLCWREKGGLSGLVPLVLSGIGFVAVIAAVWGVPMVVTGGERMPDDEFFQTLVAFRAPHHYLGLDFFRFQWILAGVFCAAAAVVFAIRLWQRGLSFEVLALAAAIGITAAACLASLHFVDMAESRLWATAQVFRMTMLLKWCAYLVLAWLFGAWTAKGGAVEAILAAIAVAAAGDALSYVLVLALAAKIGFDLARRWIGGPIIEALIWLSLPVVLAAAVFIMTRYGQDQYIVRATLALACVALIYAPLPGRDAGMGIAIVLVAAVIAITAYSRDQGLLGWNALKAEFVWSDLQSPEANIARAAKANSPADSLWLVPPRFESFRVIANRAVVADFTSIPFQDMPMREWRQRMETLFAPGDATGFKASHVMTENYRNGIDWQQAASLFGATHAVLFEETPWSGPVLFTNGTYKLVPLASP